VKKQQLTVTRMLTRPGKSEAEVKAEARCYEAEAKNFSLEAMLALRPKILA